MILPKLGEDAVDIISVFVRSKVEDSGAPGIVIGMSGGLDSSVVAQLCVHALGKERVLGIMMPERESDPNDLEHGLLMAKKLGIEHMVIDITGPQRSFVELLPKITDRLSIANAKARSRMIVLYMLANSTGMLVMGCSNKTELMLGYYTKFGDGASDYLPIGDLYKSQVRELAENLGIPSEILEKPPSAGLWEGQTDEEEIGMPYELIDDILYGFEMQLAPMEIARRAECEESQVQMLHERILRSAHKRRPPQIPKIGIRTPGFDWREY